MELNRFFVTLDDFDHGRDPAVRIWRMVASGISRVLGVAFMHLHVFSIWSFQRHSACARGDGKRMTRTLDVSGSQDIR
jgi:hypothetical protein